MGHLISTQTFSSQITTKRIQAYCDEEAIREGDYHSPLYPPIRFVDRVLESREAAEEYIDTHDKGFYDSLAIKYKNGRKIEWLVKYEYHV